MGQAKARGSYEDRKTIGEAKKAQAEAERREHEAMIEASLTPEQRKKRQEARLLISTIAGMVNEYKFK